eukprot:353534-Chlamydomonas_euryale.AAC.3
MLADVCSALRNGPRTRHPWSVSATQGLLPATPRSAARHVKRVVDSKESVLTGLGHTSRVSGDSPRRCATPDLGTLMYVSAG